MLKRALCAAVALAAATPASASTVMVTGWNWDPGLVFGNLNYDPGAPGGNDVQTRNNLGIGRFELTGTVNGSPVTFETYCVDIFKNLTTGAYTQSAPSVIMSQTAAIRINALLSHTDSLLAAATGTNAIIISAATQLAVWEILYESGSYGLSTGEFQAVPGSLGANDAAQLATAKSTADGYLSRIMDPSANGWRASTSANVTVLYAQNRQSQVYLTAVPEPATWLTMIFGFGLIGGVLRRRQASVRAASA